MVTRVGGRQTAEVATEVEERGKRGEGLGKGGGGVTSVLVGN